MQSTLSRARLMSVLSTMMVITQLNACSSVKSPADRSGGGAVQTDATGTTKGVTSDATPPALAPVAMQAASLS